jgi:hypothetical protein
MRFGGPIVTEEFLKVDLLASPGLLYPWQMSALQLDLDAQLGCRRNISTHTRSSPSVRIKETKGIQMLRWSPGPDFVSL